MTAVPFNGATLSIADLPTQAGHTRHYHVNLQAADDLGTEVMQVPQGTVVPVDIDVTSMSDGVLFHATATTTCEGACVRCLEPVSFTFPVTVDEMFFTPEAIARIRKDDGEEAVEDLLELEGNDLELEPLFRDAIVTELPFTPLCSRDCEGLCDVCGEKWRDLPDDHHHEVLDPRFAKLANFFSEADSD
ncbi:MAG: YceD family protein [Actinomycetaceae bacterium]|nr:YceD family protein [Actinomycetaceae bacterium]